MSDEIEVRKSRLRTTLQDRLPDFIEACDADVDVVVLHQDAFAADYQDAEYTLFGMAIKYAGLCGKEVHVVATPHPVTQ